MRFLVSAGTTSICSPQTSSAAARIAGSTVSLVAFMSNSANHSKTFCICCGFGLCRSSEENGTPISLMHPTISRSGCYCPLEFANPSTSRQVTHKAHKGIAVILLLATVAIIAGSLRTKLVAHSCVEVHSATTQGRSCSILKSQ